MCFGDVIRMKVIRHNYCLVSNFYLLHFHIRKVDYNRPQHSILLWHYLKAITTRIKVVEKKLKIVMQHQHSHEEFIVCSVFGDHLLRVLGSFIVSFRQLFNQSVSLTDLPLNQHSESSEKPPTGAADTLQNRPWQMLTDGLTAEHQLGTSRS